MFSFFKKKNSPAAAAPPQAVVLVDNVPSAADTEPTTENRTEWLGRLRNGLRKTSQSLSHVFTAGRIGEDLYEDRKSVV